ncbi:MAG: cation diffusion facilitator family transporter [Lachnospiraceae bacterium]|nr:cation diffusion facilitator family transporter [Lachnospiraceae bacterium]
MDKHQRTKYGQIASTIGICCNIFLAVSKLVVGVASGMISIIADSVNNFSDSISSIVTLIGFKLSSKPADEDHPFGHARYEYISGLVIAFLVMIAGVELLKESFMKILHPQEITYGWAMYGVLVLSIVVKLGMMVLYTVVGKKISSTSLLAARVDSRNDVMATGAVLISAIISYLAKINLDGWMGAVVALIVLIGGISLVQDTLNPLLGTTPDPELVEEMEKSILSYDGVLGTHDLMVHDYGPGHRFASVHVEVPAERGIMECHEVIDQIERELKEKFQMPLLIHYDPIYVEKEHIDPLYQYMVDSAKAIHESISIHDFREVECDGVHRVIFDCVVPKTVNLTDGEVLDALATALTKEYPEHQISVTFDHGFVLIN